MDQMATSARHQALEYDGRIGEIYSIFLLNILFTILTLGAKPLEVDLGVS